MEQNHLGVMIRENGQTYGDAVAIYFERDNCWMPLTYRALAENISALGRALLKLGIHRGEMIGILSRNRPEWSIADFGILSIRCVSVPLHGTCTDEEIEHIIRDTGIRTVFVGDASQYARIAAFAASHGIARIVVFDDSVTLRRSCDHHLNDLIRMGEREENEADFIARLGSAEMSDLATVMYTPGTAGEQKGVLLTHANFSEQIGAIAERFDVTPQDRSLHFLPPGHACERGWSYFFFKKGGQSYYLADQSRILEYLALVQPTAVIGMPRIYERIYAAILNRVEKKDPSRQRIFRWALRTGTAYACRKKENRYIGPLLACSHAIADRAVLARIRAFAGGGKRFMATGGAGLAREIEEFFFAAGILICQGYLLTETTSLISTNAPGLFKFGTAGKPVRDCSVKIADDGEILVRGGSVMQGYLNRSAETAAAFENGWLRTGDIGAIDEEGFLRVIDRKRDLIVTPAGKLIPPQRIEQCLRSDYYIDQVAVIGSGRKFLCAIIVPNFNALEEYAKAVNIKCASREELTGKAEIVEFFRKRVEERCERLASTERIREFILLPHEFRQERGEVTCTRGIRRAVIEQRYALLIDALYRE